MGTVVAWVALLLSVAALFGVWKLGLDLSTANRRLDRYKRSLYDAGDQIRKLEQKLAETTAILRVEMMHQGAPITVRPEMTVGQVTALHPQAKQVLAGLHIGGCSSCAANPDETLAQICADNGLDLSQVLGNLNSLFQVGMTPSNGSGRVPQPVKVPNIELISF